MIHSSPIELGRRLASSMVTVLSLVYANRKLIYLQVNYNKLNGSRNVGKPGNKEKRKGSDNSRPWLY